MAYAKTWLASAFVLAAGVALSGCNPSNDDSKPYPADPQTFVANYNVTTGLFFPFPSDYPAYAGTTDGTLNYTGLLASAPFTLTAEQPGAGNLCRELRKAFVLDQQFTGGDVPFAAKCVDDAHRLLQSDRGLGIRLVCRKQ